MSQNIQPNNLKKLVLVIIYMKIICQIKNLGKKCILASFSMFKIQKFYLNSFTNKKIFNKNGMKISLTKINKKN